MNEVNTECVDDQNLILSSRRLLYSVDANKLCKLVQEPKYSDNWLATGKTSFLLNIRLGSAFFSST